MDPKCRSRRGAGALLAGCFLCSCTDSAVQPLEDKVEQLRRDVAALTVMVANQNMEDPQVNEALEALQRIEYALASEQFITLKPGSDGYGVIRFSLGSLTLDVRNIAAYANGTRMTFVFGNPLSSTLNGVSISVSYGEVNEAGVPIEETVKSKEIKLNKSLSAGAWTSVQVTLDNITPAKLGFISVGNVEHTGIILRQ